MTIEKAAETALALPVEPAKLKDIMLDNFAGGGTPTLTRVSVPTGGGRQFKLNDPEGERLVNELTGVVLFQHRARAYWASEFQGGTPPDCRSVDGMSGRGEPGGSCAGCPLNEWGSDPRGGRGKACKEMVRVYLLQNNELLPVVLTLPPTSLGEFASYVSGLTRKAVSIRGVMTSFGLEVDKNEGGIEYSKVIPQRVGDLSGDDTASIRALSELLGPLLQEMPLDQEGAEAVETQPEGSAEAPPKRTPGPRPSRRPDALDYQGTIMQDPELRYSPDGVPVVSIVLESMKESIWFVRELAEQVNQLKEGEVIAVSAERQERNTIIERNNLLLGLSWRRLGDSPPFSDDGGDEVEGVPF